MNNLNFDAVIIGGGPAGYVAAIQLAKMGATVAIVEEDRFGGTCLNRGCIPTKTFYHYAKLLNEIKHNNNQGLQVSDVKVDMGQISERKEAVVNELVTGIEQLLESLKVSVFRGKGQFVNDHEIQVNLKGGEKCLVLGQYIIVATGSKPKMVPIQGLEEGVSSGRVVTSKEILELKEIPNSLTIIGGGVIGMEFATIFNQFGTQVTVIEALDRILSSFHNDLVKRYKPFVRKQGISLKTKTLAKSIDVMNSSVNVTVDNGKEKTTIESDLVLLSVGRIPNNIELFESKAGISDLAEVNDFLQTSVAHIYSVGDVNGLSMLAHSASKQGIIAANDIGIKLGLVDSMSINHSGFSSYSIPNCAFLLPEVAEVSKTSIMNRLSEDKKALKQAPTGMFNYRSNGMAKALFSEEGLCKTVFHEDALIYMGIIGEMSAELIMEGVHMIDHQLSFKEMDSVVAHPSLNEILHESLLDAYKKAIHKI